MSTITSIRIKINTVSAEICRINVKLVTDWMHRNNKKYPKIFRIWTAGAAQYSRTWCIISVKYGRLVVKWKFRNSRIPLEFRLFNFFLNVNFFVVFLPFLATHFPLHACAQRWRGTTWCMIDDMYIFLKHIFNSSYAGILICLFWSKFPFALQAWKCYPVKIGINGNHLHIHKPLTCMCLIAICIIFPY